VSSLAHCIKNVINGLKGGAYILDIGLKRSDEERTAKGWEMVKRNTDFMLELVQNMLAYCRKTSLKREPTDLAALLGETVLMVQEAAAQRGVEVSTALQKALPELDVDPTEVKRAVLNLLTNAVEACTAGGRVCVAAQMEDGDGQCRITVQDDGHGIPQDVEKHLFEPLFTTKGSRGTGLGLALVKKVVEEHGGRVEVESEAGRGTAFHVIIPSGRAGPHSAAGLREPSAPQVEDTNGKESVAP